MVLSEFYCIVLFLQMWTARNAWTAYKCLVAIRTLAYYVKV